MPMEPESTRFFKEKAKNRVLARLLACLVNERFIKAELVSSDSLPVSLSSKASAKLWVHVHDDDEISPSRQGGGFWFPLQGLPALTEKHPPASPPTSSSYSVSLLDLEDIAFPVLQEKQLDDDNIGYVSADVRSVMQELKRWSPSLDALLVDKLTLEMENCAAHQEAAYHHHHGRQLPSLASSQAVEWEQVIVEGHPIHPMYKARVEVPPTLPIDPWNNNLLNPHVHFFAVPRGKLTLRGDFEKLLAPLVGEDGCHAAGGEEVIVPVHEVQVPSILHYFPFARHLSFTRRARAQASVRSVVLPELPDLNLKLAIGVKIGSAMRTVTPCSAYNGPACKPVAEAVIRDKQLLEPAEEVATVVSNHPDEDVAKLLSCIIRQDPQHLAGARGERAVLCSALKERYGDEGEFIVNTILKLDSSEKRESFFYHYARLYLQAFVLPLSMHGVAFEAHLQNVFARFKPVKLGDVEEWELVGFTVRDFGGIKVHQPTLLSTTGMQLDVFEEESTKVAHTMEEAHNLAYHAMIQGHLQPMARALGVHYNGKGWKFVRKELEHILPLGCETKRLWLHSDTANWKAFIRMKFQSLYRDYLYTQVANLIVYEPPSFD